MNAQKFPGHGQFTATVNDQILIVDAVGPANKETMDAYASHASRTIEKFNNTPWGQVLRLTGTPMAIPEAKEVMLDVAKYAVSKKMVCTALVFHEVEFIHIAIQFWEDIFNTVGAKCKVFSNSDDAFIWVDKYVRQSHENNDDSP
jgi:hypothetical protein